MQGQIQACVDRAPRYTKSRGGSWLREAVFHGHGATSDVDVFLELSQFIQNRFANYEKQ